MHRTKFINLQLDQVVYAIIASGAFKPQSTTAEDIAQEMAEYALLVKQSVLETVQRAEGQEDY